MNKFIILLTVSFAITACNGPKSGPLVKESFEEKDQSSAMTAQQHQGQPVIVKADVKIEPCADCISIEKLISDKKSYSGKTVKIKGVVTKINEGIMGKNWIHIQDGTESEGVFDLTVTTMENASVGETITFEGEISLDKDFGYGYFYKILLEDAKIVL